MEEWNSKAAERAAAAAEVSGAGAAAGSARGEQQYVAYVPLPDIKEIEAIVMEKKKRELLAKYTSENLLAEQAEAKSLLNKRA